MTEPLDKAQINEQIRFLHDLNDKEPRHTTVRVHEDADAILYRLQRPFNVDGDWRCFNCVLALCLESLLNPKPLQPDLFVIPRLQFLNYRLQVPGSEVTRPRIDRRAWAIAKTLKGEFAYTKHWQRINALLMRALSDNDRLLATCEGVVSVEEAA